MLRLDVTVPPDLLQDLKREAERTGKSVSEVVRERLELARKTVMRERVVGAVGATMFTVAIIWLTVLFL